MFIILSIFRSVLNTDSVSRELGASMNESWHLAQLTEGSSLPPDSYWAKIWSHINFSTLHLFLICLFYISTNFCRTLPSAFPSVFDKLMFTFL